MASTISPTKPPPAAETVLFYVLARGPKTRNNVPAFEASQTNVKEKHFVQPLFPDTVLAVENFDLPALLNGVRGFHAKAPKDEQSEIYGDMTVDDMALSSLPDLFKNFSHHSFYCSEKAKAVIEAEDPDIHQFVPISIFRKGDGGRIDTEFFGVIPGRYLYLKRDGSHPKPRMDYIEHPPVTNLLERIQKTPDAHQLIQSWPLWAHGTTSDRPFFSPALYRALVAAGVSGIDEIGEGQISPETETIGHIFR